ncbi:MAG: Hsp70 family protein [Deltaproteobacteria bacterium]|nr:Hsp70 family protein [Deltaproteobacteria bacterium]
MATPFVPALYAIDFGTSNSLLAAASADGVTAPIPLEVGVGHDPSILRSVLYFPGDGTSHCGQEALRRYVDNGMEGRVLRSMKRHLSSRHFTGTMLGGRHVTPAELVSVVLREMRARANAHFGADVRRAVLGRPARFSLDDADDALARERLAEAARIAGFEEVSFLEEPVAAARDFGSSLDAERVALICDFGGGTSDFTVIRLGPRTFRRADVLAMGGVPVAGDAYDASIMRHRVAKHFGSEVTYRVPLGANVMRMPPAIVERLCSPFDLTILRRQDIATFLRNVQSWSLGSEDSRRMEQLFALVDDALGFQVFEAIERAKRTLSSELSAVIEIAYEPIEIREEITRPAFDEVSERATELILAALDDTMKRAGVADDRIDVVVSTGGTAKLPRIGGALRSRFGRESVRDFKSFHSVVDGLAQHARSIARGEIASGTA